MTHAGFRDAIHVPYIMVTCDTVIEPGDKVSLRHNNKCVKWMGLPDTGGEWVKKEPMWHGVADPFLEDRIPSGTLFAVHIRKECFARLRHDFHIEVHDTGGTDTCHSVCDIF
jgi:hypothetical protein